MSRKPLVIFSFVLIYGSQTLAQPDLGQSVSSLININNVAMWVRSDGYSANNPFSEDDNAIQWGIIYPRGTPVGVVWVDGFIWGGLVRDGQEPVLRVGGHTYSTGLQPGAIISKGVAENPEDPQVNHVWRYRPDWQNADLKEEAFVILASRPGASAKNFQFTEQEKQEVADSLRVSYENDLDTWPWQKGAPFYDLNENGVMDVGEEPGLLDADQVVWFVANDLNPELTQALFGSPPIGIEMQVTLWAYHGNFQLENTIFRRVRFIYKGTTVTPDSARIDSMGVGIFSDVDLGNYGDDLAGTDTTLQMVFAYNGDSRDDKYLEFDLSPPALGYTLLQGPLVAGDSENDRAWFDFLPREGYRNLPMTGSWVEGAGDPDSQPSRGIYDGTVQYWSVLNGFHPRPPFTPFLDPFTLEVTKFTRTGDPLTNTGWLDVNRGSRTVTITSTNFDMALEDTQEVIVAMVAGLGSDRLASFSVMKYFVGLTRLLVRNNFQVDVKEEETPEPSVPEFFELHQNFPNPFNPSTEIRYELPAEFRVKLTIFNILGQKVKSLVDETQGAGAYSMTWNGTNDEGRNVPSGLYFYKIELGRFSETKKMLLVR